MNELAQGILIGLIPAIVVSIFTSYITVNLSLKQFYSQRWWDKKETEYTQIMRELARLKLCFSDWYESFLYHKRVTEQDSKKLNETYKRASESLSKISAIGTFVVSEETVTALDGLLSQFEQETPRGDPLDDIERDYIAVEKCIKEVTQYARKDLRKK